ncbi:MAG: translation initiation factor [Tannerellaceae bacterium]|jgi:translation initiation factor 1|nr:translation initiation factor [Tannerellaceae bacterium]
MKEKERSGIVYSTDPHYAFEEAKDVEKVDAGRQLLRVSLDKKGRQGKAVTLITGFKGSDDELSGLGKWLKVKCGVGGSAKDGEIILQGDLRKKALDILQKEGYTRSRII